MPIHPPVWEHPAIVGYAIALLIIMGAWVIIDLALQKSDKRESDKIHRDIQEAYRKMRNNGKS